MPVVAHLLPSGSDIALLSEHLDVRAGRASSSTATFYDTFDGRLHADGVALRHEGGTLALLDRETEEELATGPGTAARRLFDHDLPDALRERLADVIEMRALTPVARVQTRRTPVAVLNSDAKTVVRLTVEEHPSLQTRLRATAVRGYDSDLERVLDVLAELELQPATVPLVDEAIVARGGTPAGTSAKINVALDPEAPATTAAAAIFTRLVEVIGENLPGTLDDVDSEFLHDLRVAVRRSRSLQRQFAGVYPSRLQHFRDEFKRLQAETGDLRDLDVYLLDFDELRAMLPEQMRADLVPLRDLLAARRARALTATRRALKSKRTEDALAEWLTFVQRVPPAAPVGPGSRLAPHLPRVPQDGQDGHGDRRRLARRGPARAAQGRQGAALPARVLRRPLPGRGRQAVREDAQVPAGPVGPLPGPRGPGEHAARRSRPTSPSRSR